MIFKRKKAVEEPAVEPADLDEAAVQDAEQTGKPKLNGPFDYKDVEDTDDYLDFGSILVKPIAGLKVRMDVEQSNQRVVAVSLEVAESRVQLMAFSASKSESLWPGISDKIREDIKGQNGEIYQRDGDYGQELLAQVPQQLPDGRAGHVALRFVGIDGPRWFLRAVVGGAAISDEEAAKTIDSLIRSVIVNRGDKPLPPQELLPLSVPTNAQARPAEEEEPENTAPQRPERGPEITQIG
ncbi:DUF3710 domain-containing protein [Glutamicibacter sp.]|uniref:DUF3710 domain-containing protein n=1 Tax=Glutamicibacter sp. TaxID=1931995 RepID=UPI0028BD6561|nr:DUF3710 domain-containing protein [Glutamicibacter sp.]